MLLCLGGTRKRMLEGPRLCSFFYLIYNHNTSPGFGKNNGRLLHTTYYHETSTVDGEVGLLSYLKMLANLPSPQWESECAKSFEKIVESKLGLSTQKWILEFYPESIEGTANCLSFVNPTDGETKRINLGIFRAKLLWVLLLHTWREGGKKGQITIPLLLTYFGIEKSEQKMGWTTTTTVKRTLWLFHTFKTWREFWSKLIVAAVVVLRKIYPWILACYQSQLQIAFRNSNVQ